MQFALQKYPQSGLFLARPGASEQAGDSELTLYLANAELFPDIGAAMSAKSFEPEWRDAWPVFVLEHSIYEDEFNRYYGYGRWERSRHAY